MVATLVLFAVSGLILGKTADLLLPKSYREEPLRSALLRCQECRRTVVVRDAVPLIEALDRGRCAACGARFPLRWLLLPIGCSLAAAACYLEFDNAGQAAVGTLFSSLLLALVFTDIERRLLPDRIVLSGMALAAGLAWLLPEMSAIEALYGGLVGLGIAVALILVSLPFGAGAFGMGDAKVILFLGILLGPSSAVVAVFASTMAAGLFAIVLLATRRRRFGDYLPHGPFLVMGGITGLLWGTEIWDWYAN
ncbi:MAG TPA: A24 family peptidase [Dehalococcoidia bacterium]